MGDIILGVAAALLGAFLLALALTPPHAGREQFAYWFTGIAPPFLLFVIAARLIFGG